MGIHRATGAIERLQARLPQQPQPGQLARAAALLYLVGLGVVLTTAWHAPVDGAGEAIAGFPAWHLAFLMASGTVAAMLTLGNYPRTDAALPTAEAPAAGSRVSELMAQMSHELRTPLNAVIGFSDVMLRELHGPLGNARYQEYAHHISESGGRLLKSSEEALAVTEAMSALMADRQPGRRERLIAANLVRDAWREAMPASGGAAPRLALTTCTTCDIRCERRPTAQALEHLFREALGRLPAGGTIEVTGRRRGGQRSIEVRVEGGDGVKPLAGTTAEKRDGQGREGDPMVAGSSLRVILARLLLEVQGASLVCTDVGGRWVAVVEFAGRV